MGLWEVQGGWVQGLSSKEQQPAPARSHQPQTAAPWATLHPKQLTSFLHFSTMAIDASRILSELLVNGTAVTLPGGTYTGAAAAAGWAKSGTAAPRSSSSSQHRLANAGGRLPWVPLRSTPNHSPAFSTFPPWRLTTLASYRSCW